MRWFNLKWFSSTFQLEHQNRIYFPISSISPNPTQLQTNIQTTLQRHNYIHISTNTNHRRASWRNLRRLHTVSKQRSDSTWRRQLKLMRVELKWAELIFHLTLWDSAIPSPPFVGLVLLACLLYLICLCLIVWLMSSLSLLLLLVECSPLVNDFICQLFRSRSRWGERLNHTQRESHSPLRRD